MASETATGRTPVRVARLATENQALNRSETGLLGVFGPARKLSALVRLPNGRVRRVENGEKIGIGRVMAIDEHGLMLEKNGRTWRLALPPG